MRPLDECVLDRERAPAFEGASRERGALAQLLPHFRGLPGGPVLAADENDVNADLLITVGPCRPNRVFLAPFARTDLRHLARRMQVESLQLENAPPGGPYRRSTDPWACATWWSVTPAPLGLSLNSRCESEGPGLDALIYLRGSVCPVYLRSSGRGATTRGKNASRRCSSSSAGRSYRTVRATSARARASRGSRLASRPTRRAPWNPAFSTRSAVFPCRASSPSSVAFCTAVSVAPVSVT